MSASVEGGEVNGRQGKKDRDATFLHKRRQEEAEFVVKKVIGPDNRRS